jgi:iron complex outermembrane receptor protein
MTGMVDFSLIPVYIIDELDLTHGNASVANRSGGLGGSINIENKVDWSKKLNLKFLQGAGSFSTFDEFLQLGGGTRKLQLKTRAYHNFSENDYPFVNRSIGNINPETGTIEYPTHRNEKADYRRYGILQEIYYRPNQKNIFSARYWSQKAERTIPRPTSYEGPENSNLNRQIDIDRRLLMDWKRYSDHSKFLLRSGYSTKNLDYTLKNKISGRGFTPAIYSLSKQESFLNTISYNYDLSEKLSIKTSLEANYHRVNTEDTVRKTGYMQDRLEWSGFLSVHRNFGSRLNLNLMLRQDLIDQKFIPVIPYLGFDFRLHKDEEIFLKGNIARNYRIPSLNDLYWQPGGNPDLSPEEGISGELGLEFRKLMKGHYFKTELTAFRSDINNWIIWIPSYKGYWEPRNIKRVLSEGVEYNLSLKGEIFAINYHASASYAYTRSLNYGDPLVWGDESYGKQLVYVPLHSGNFLLNLSYKGYFISYQYNSYSERYTTSSNDISRRDWLYPYLMNDMAFGKDFSIHQLKLSAEFKIYNLLNETYHSVLYRPMPGRNYMIILRLNI